MSAVQPAKPFLLTVESSSGKIIFLSEVQFSKQDSPIFNKLSGKSIEESDEQFLNAQLPMLSRTFERLTFLRLIQLLNALLSIVSTVSGIVTSFSPVQDSKRCAGILIMPSSKVIFPRLEQFAKGE